MRVVVTGISGFIGSAFVRRVFDAGSPFAEAVKGWTIVGLARNSDQGNLRRLNNADVRSAQESGKLRVVYGDILGDVSGLCEGADAVVHFAAKTFVDHSIRDARPFVESNVLGTLNMLEDARRNRVKRWIQIGTDEVYGSILEGAYTEDSRLNPTNPYSASKAGADALAICYAHTYGLHTTVTRTENNYGPFQHRQKVLPTFVRSALKGDPLPVYGDGQHARQWLWMDDHVDAILTLLTSEYEPGQIFHVAGSHEMKNLDLAKMVLKTLGKPETQIKFIEDHHIRPGHDRRYALDSGKIRKAFGWDAKVTPDVGIPAAVRWYAENSWWTQ